MYKFTELNASKLVDCQGKNGGDPRQSLFWITRIENHSHLKNQLNQLLIKPL